MDLETSDGYINPGPSREEVDAMKGAVLLNFGTDWCGYCQALKPQLALLLKQHPDVKHVKVEDGKGRPLGRSFRVRLWPTLVFLRGGSVVQQLARPSLREIKDGLRTFVDRG